MEEELKDKGNKQHVKQFDWLDEYKWQKGQSGNPKGRPKGKTLKEWAREFLMSMSDEARVKFISSLEGETVWKMAEGNPKTETDITSKGESIVVDAKTIAIAKKFEEELNKQEDATGKSIDKSLDLTEQDKNGVGQGT